MDTFERIKQLVIIKIGEENINLTQSTRIYEDLKIDGDDAFELLKSFEREFNVDMTDFEYNNYFAPEGIDLIGGLINIFKKNKKKLLPLTLGDLETVAKKGKWLTAKN